MPLRRYQTPSLVRHTSSASILPPLVSTITALPPCLFAMPGPLVETKSVEERACDDVAVGAIEGFGDGDGDGEGETLGDGEGRVVNTASGDATGATMAGFSVATDVRRRLMP